MFKILTFLVLGYFAYRYFIRPFFLPPNRKKQLIDEEPKVKGGDYIDYEDV